MPADVVEMARAATPKAIAALIKKLDDPDDCIEAAIALLDRGWGKPPQAILAQVDATLTLGGIDAPPIIDESDAEWLARRRGELALIAAETKPRH